MTPVDQVAQLGAALGRDLVLAPLPDEAVLEQLGPAYGAAAIEIFRDHPHLETDVQRTVELLLGRPPGPLSGWITRNASRFRV